MEAILGIDVGEETLVVALWREGQALERGEFKNRASGFKQLQTWLRRREAGPVWVCMEATGRYWEQVAEYLVGQGHRVSVVNPARVKALAHSQLARNKTDRLDAVVIADFCRTQQPPLWTPPPAELAELQALVRHLQDLENDRQRQRNRLHALRYAAQPSATVQHNLEAQIEFLSQQIAQVQADIQTHIDQHPHLRQQRDLLDSIKGIGPLTAAKLLGELGDMSQFRTVRQGVAFAGLNPRQHQSGTSVRGKPAISKVGRASIRAALYLPAVVAKRHDSRLAAWAAELKARGLAPQAIITAVMRKLLHLAFGVLKSGRPYDPHFQERIAQPA